MAMSTAVPLSRLYRGLRRSLELRRYTPRTISEFLRKRGVTVGSDCFIIPTDLDLETEPYLLKIGDHVAIAAGVSIMTRESAAWLFPDGDNFGPVVIEDNCFIGYRAIICPNVRIGPNSIVGAGSVVTSDVPPNTIAMGVPARPFGSLDRYREKCLQRWAEQRPPGIVIEPGETWWNSKHFDQNRQLLKERLLALFQTQLS